MPVPGIFEETPFDPRGAWWLRPMNPSPFIKPMHPKTMIAPERNAIQKVIAAGWWGQPKVHGHRAQIHIPADKSLECKVYNRQGRLHKERLSSGLESELRRIFTPKKDWNCIDAEWLKPQEKIFVFDFLKYEGALLDESSFAERYELIPKLYLSPHLSTLPVFKTTDACMNYLSSPLPDYIEGLVFRAANTKGFSDSAIVRCRV